LSAADDNCAVPLGERPTSRGARGARHEDVRLRLAEQHLSRVREARQRSVSRAPIPIGENNGSLLFGRLQQARIEQKCPFDDDRVIKSPPGAHLLALEMDERREVLDDLEAWLRDAG
jgi:hypothetical protein